jgi:uncharacterized protein (DUF2336 family)
MLQALLDLAKQPDSDKRRELLDAVAKLFFANSRADAPESEAKLFSDLATRLLKDLPTADRAAFAAQVAADPRTPRDIVMALVNDEDQIAALVLERSPIFSESDLVDLAHRREKSQRVAIAKREDVAAAVTDATIVFGEIDVMEAVLDNASSIVSPRGYEQIATQAEIVEVLREPLCLRPDVPATVLSRIAPLLDAASQARLRAMLAARKPAPVPQVLSEKDEAAMRRASIKAMARMVEASELPLNEFVADLISTRHPPDLALGLSELSLLPERQIANAILAIDAEALALICKALSIEPETYRRVEELRRQVMKLAFEIPGSVMSSYNAMSPAQAQRALRMVSVGGLMSATR